MGAAGGGGYIEIVLNADNECCDFLFEFFSKPLEKLLSRLVLWKKACCRKKDPLNRVFSEGELSGETFGYCTEFFALWRPDVPIGKKLNMEIGFPAFFAWGKICGESVE